MTDAVLRVRHAGPLVTYQDAGRPRLMRFGVPLSGPMDPVAHAAANVAVGRPTGATAVEVSLGGLIVDCADGPVTVAVCGGGFTVEHSGERCDPWTVRTLQSGDVLKILAGPWGSWCYLAVGGRLAAPTWLGSSATHVRAGLGGGQIAAGHELIVRDTTTDPARDGTVELPTNIRPRGELRVVPGPQLDRFHADALTTLLGSPYTLSSAYDRMGVRLDGPALLLDDALDIASTPIVRGSIQVAGDGVPTLLFADHQTSGGYPKIATVLGDDAARAVQLRAGDTVRFVAVDPAAAIASARAAATQRDTYLARVADRPGLRTRLLLTANLIGGIHHPSLDEAIAPS